MNVFVFQERKIELSQPSGIKRKVRARHEAAARARLPRPRPGYVWTMIEVQNPAPHPSAEIPVLKEQVVPLTWGQGGPVIGSAHVLSNGRVMARVDTIGTDMGVFDSKALLGISLEGTIAPYFKE